MSSYRDENGRVYFVSDGISQGEFWGTFYRSGTGSLRRYRGLPMREDKRQAEEDLKLYAAARKWIEVK